MNFGKLQCLSFVDDELSPISKLRKTNSTPHIESAWSPGSPKLEKGGGGDVSRSSSRSALLLHKAEHKISLSIGVNDALYHIYDNLDGLCLFRYHFCFNRRFWWL